MTGMPQMVISFERWGSAGGNVALGSLKIALGHSHLLASFPGRHRIKTLCATGCCYQKWCLWNVSWNTGNNSPLWVVCHGYLVTEWKVVTHTSMFCWEIYIWIYQDIDIDVFYFSWYYVFIWWYNKFIFSCGIVFHFIKWVWKCPALCSLSFKNEKRWHCHLYYFLL